jgi:hypothetical protein
MNMRLLHFSTLQQLLLVRLLPRYYRTIVCVVERSTKVDLFHVEIAVKISAQHFVLECSNLRSRAHKSLVRSAHPD